MKPLDDLIKRQQLGTHPNSETAEVDSLTFVRFESQARCYVAEIRYVREVTDELAVVRYPEPSEGHLGVVSLRGEILPVVGTTESTQPVSASRLLVLEFTDGMPFCVRASGIKKVMVPRRDYVEGDPVKVDGRAAVVASEKLFITA